MHLLDGQQRMTALWRALTGNYDDLTLFVPLERKEPDPESEDNADDAPAGQAERRWSKTQKAAPAIKMPLWADDHAQVFDRGLLPIECLCPGQTGERRLEMFKSALTAAGKDLGPYYGRIYELRQRVAGYMVPFLSLPVGTGKETALDVFIKMNTSASPLTDYDIVVAQLEEALGQSLHDMVAELKRDIPALERYGNVEDNVLAVGALLNGLPPLKKTYLSEDFGRQLSAVWPRLRRGFERGLEFLKHEGLLGEKILPSEVAVYLVCALWADVPEHGYDQEGNARGLIRKALWRACFTDRYGKTATTRAHADYRALAAIIAGKQVDASPELFNEADTFSASNQYPSALPCGQPSAFRSRNASSRICCSRLATSNISFTKRAPNGIGELPCWATSRFNSSSEMPSSLVQYRTLAGINAGTVLRASVGLAVRHYFSISSLSISASASATKRAYKLRGKGNEPDLRELLRMEPVSGVTNIRNTSSRHWKRCLGIENRCVVPITSFSEFNKTEDGDI